MNFKTRLSYNNRVTFVYKNGDTKQTPFTEVLYSGDNYILAKSETDTFYCLLDLNGDNNDNHQVIHRFQNGLLLIYKSFIKQYRSSDNIEYSINYNVYSILNYDTGKQYMAGIVQSDAIEEEDIINVVGKKYVKTIIRYFLNKPLYCFKDFIFSEILDNQYLLTGTPLMANPVNINPGPEGYPDFDAYMAKKVWAVVDIFSQKKHTTETDIIETTTYGLTFKESELHLLEVITMPDRPEKVSGLPHDVYNDLNKEYSIYRIWKNNNKLHKIIRNVLSFVRN